MPQCQYPIPVDEELRQAAVFGSGVLSMQGNAVLRQVVDRTAQLFDVPIVAVSIIDRDRQWFPVVIGLECDETHRDLSFCAHAILTPDDILCVPDATCDPRFAANDLVTGEPHIRFYISAPLVTSQGVPLGALCAIDRVPRPAPAPPMVDALCALAKEAMREIERPENLRRFATSAIELLVEQLRSAIGDGEERRIVALDRHLRSIERRIWGKIDRG